MMMIVPLEYLCFDLSHVERGNRLDVNHAHTRHTHTHTYIHTSYFYIGLCVVLLTLQEIGRDKLAVFVGLFLSTCAGFSPFHFRPFKLHFFFFSFVFLWLLLFLYVRYLNCWTLLWAIMYCICVIVSPKVYYRARLILVQCFYTLPAILLVGGDVFPSEALMVLQYSLPWEPSVCTLTWPGFFHCRLKSAVVNWSFSFSKAP